MVLLDFTTMAISKIDNVLLIIPLAYCVCSQNMSISYFYVHSTQRIAIIHYLSTHISMCNSDKYQKFNRYNVYTNITKPLQILSRAVHQ